MKARPAVQRGRAVPATPVPSEADEADEETAKEIARQGSKMLV
jgi:hypothetical protein